MVLVLFLPKTCVRVPVVLQACALHCRMQDMNGSGLCYKMTDLTENRVIIARETGSSMTSKRAKQQVVRTEMFCSFVLA